jgi:Uma2 family endonuclease
MAELATKPMLMTVEEYLKLPEQTNKCELINGELVMSPAPNWYHQGISSNIEYALQHYLRARRVGQMVHAPFDVMFNPVTVLQPDIVFLSTASLAHMDHHGLHGAPDLVIEILSQGNSRRDLGEKRQLYQEYLVKEIWYVSPKHKTVEIERLEGEGYGAPVLFADPADVLTTPLLPGFGLSLEAVFASPLPPPE